MISDYNLNGMDGIEFLKLVRARHPSVCRMMLTGTASLDVVVRSINDGEVYRFLLKPWDNVLLRVTVYFAFEELQLREDNRRLIAALRQQLEFIHSLERQFPGIPQKPVDTQLSELISRADSLTTPGA